MWHILKNEWQYLRRNRALLVVSLGFVATLMLSIFLGHQQTQAQAERQQAAKAHLRAQWEGIDGMNPHGAAHYGTYVFKPSSLLSSLDGGVNGVTGNVLRVEGHVQNEIVHTEASQMQTASAFGKLKSSLLLQYILPLLLIFLAFHSISSEKKSGRLKLLVLQGASSGALIWGKTLTVWLYGLVLLSITMGSYVLLHLQALTSDILSRTLLFYLRYSLYYFIISGLTVFLSAFWQRATLALTTMLGVWILWTIFLPNILMSAVETWHELPSRNAFQTAMKTDRAQGLDGHNPSDERSQALEQQVLQEYGVDSLSQLPIDYNGLLMQADEEYGNQVWDKHFGQLRAVMERQKQSYQLAGMLNPFISLQNASRGFAASDNLHHHDFLLQVENYRRVFIKTLNHKQAYGGAITGEWDWEADNEFYRSVPDFEYQATPLATVLPTYGIDLAMLLIWAGLIGVLLAFATKKLHIS
ncbi:MAG: DUF3526 domain-containing protein [Bacteroidota bacterium]